MHGHTQTHSGLPAPVFCRVTNQRGIRGPQHWPVSWASVEPAGQGRPVTNNKFATRWGSRSIVLWGWRRNRPGIKWSGISNSRPALVCPPGPLSPQPMWSHLSAGCRGRVCFPTVSLLCYWARQGCQMSLLWCVERPLNDSLAWPSCHSQVSQTPTVCQTSTLQRQWLLPVCVCAACLSDRLPAMIKLPSSCDVALHLQFTVHHKFLEIVSLFKQIQTVRLRLCLTCQKWQTA